MIYREDKVYISAGFGGGKVIYFGHDIRHERGHILVTDLKTGAEWREDTISDAKKTIDIMRAVKQQSADLYGKLVKENETEESV